MGEITTISWTDHTFNPWIGCTKVSPGCKNCYAERLNARYGNENWGPGVQRRVTSDNYWKQPLKWAKKAAQNGVREKVFSASQADIFDQEAPIEARRRLWQLIRETCYALDWQIVTKRPHRIAIVMAEDSLADQFFLESGVWLLTSTEDQEAADHRIPALLKVPAAIHGISAEPLLGGLDIRKYLNVVCPVCEGSMSIPVSGGGKPCPACFDHKDGQGHADALDWVIAGGESQYGARPMDPDWVRGLTYQCRAAGVPFFFKQWGEYMEKGLAIDVLGDDSPVLRACSSAQAHRNVASSRVLVQHDLTYIRIGTKMSGALLDGRDWQEFPARPRFARLLE